MQKENKEIAKKAFEEPIIEVVIFEEDIIKTSGFNSDDDTFEE